MIDGKQIKSHRDLIVWQKAVDLTVLIYQVTKSFPREEIYGLTSQIRRASASIAAILPKDKAGVSVLSFNSF